MISTDVNAEVTRMVASKLVFTVETSTVSSMTPAASSILHGGRL
jgi:hypothetical protein